MKKFGGFTIYELLITVAVMVAITPFIYSAIKDLMQKRTAMEYADYSNTYANKFIENIEANYNTYYPIAQNNPNQIQVIPFSKIKNTVPRSLNWGLIPCVAMRYESANKEIQAVMFYTDNIAVKYKKINRPLGIKAMNEFGRGAAYYDSGVVNGINGTWALAKNSPFLNISSVMKCDSSALTSNGLVINLNMLENFPRGTAKTSTEGQYLSRIKDENNQFGDVSNANTMQADIMMQSNEDKFGIFISGNESSSSKDEQIYVGALGSKGFDAVYKNKYSSDTKYSDESSLVVIGGGVQADKFIVHNVAIVGSSCKSAQSGMIVQSNQNGILICDGHSFVEFHNSVHYNFAAPGVKSASCPKGLYVKPGSVSIATPDINKMAFDHHPTMCWKIDKTNVKSSDVCLLSPMPSNLKYDVTSSGTFKSKFFYLYSGVSISSYADTRAFAIPDPNRSKDIISCDCDYQEWVTMIKPQDYGGLITGITCANATSAMDIRAEGL